MADALRSSVPALSNGVLLITEREAAELIGVRRQRLTIWRCWQQGPNYYKIGSAVRYDLNAVLRFIETRRALVERLSQGGSTPSSA